MVGGYSESESELQGGSTKLGPSSFFNYVFNFDSDNKAVIFNMFQYIISVYSKII